MTIVSITNAISTKLVFVSFIDLHVPAGLISYPFTFVISDLITEVYGGERAKFLVRTALGINLLSLAIIQLSMALPTHDIGMNEAFTKVFQGNLYIVLGSLVAYFSSQMIDINIYEKIKEHTGNQYIWLRNNVSTLFAQAVDTVIVFSIYLWWGLGLESSEVLRIMIFSYFYKALFSLLDTPLLYFSLYCIKHYIKNDVAYESE
ncbi:MAG: queuosine precursor transporter [Chlamydiota bacterium]|nr:queuosine precursor transporter [Chlamydiota bacterium]